MTTAADTAAAATIQVTVVRPTTAVADTVCKGS
jgi:hypothetical protein